METPIQEGTSQETATTQEATAPEATAEPAKELSDFEKALQAARTPKAQEGEEAPVEGQEKPKDGEEEDEPKEEGTPQQQLARIRKEKKALARKWRAAERKEAEVSKREAELTKAQSELEAIKADPIAYLEKAGLTISDWANATLGKKSKRDDSDPLYQELQAIKKKLEEKEQAESSKVTEYQRAQEAQQTAKFISDYYTTNSKDYSNLSAYLTAGIEDSSQVFSEIAERAVKAYYEKGEAPDVEEILERLDTEAEKRISNARKLAGLPNGNPPAPSGSVSSPKNGVAPSLTNKAVSQVNATQEPKDPAEWDEYIKNKYFRQK